MPWEFKNPGILIQDEVEEWVNPDAPPAFEDIGEGLDFLDEAERAARDEMEVVARERMKLDTEDPTQQQYFRREDKRTIVRTEAEYVQCQVKGIRMTVVPYEAAVHALKEQEARVRQEKKAKAKKKTARKARKRNR